VFSRRETSPDATVSGGMSDAVADDSLRSHVIMHEKDMEAGSANKRNSLAA
jgi:hypothetical protein